MIALQTTTEMAWSGSQFQQLSNSPSAQRWDKLQNQRKYTRLSDDGQGKSVQGLNRLKQQQTTNGNQGSIVKVQDVNQASLNIVIILFN